jgi:hypothetical protein
MKKEAYTQLWKPTIEVRRLVINLCIKKQPRYLAYRRSRAGQHVFNRVYQIAQLITHGINNNNIITQKNIKPLACSTKKKYPNSKLELFNLGFLNIRSLRKHYLDLEQLISDHKLDVCTLAETWLKEGTSQHTLLGLVPKDYSIISYPRPGKKRGGGLALIHSDRVKVQHTERIKESSAFEGAVFKITSNESQYYDLAVIYRPPDTNTLIFIEEFSQFLCQFLLNPQPMIVGDFNFHMDRLDSTDTINFVDCLDSFGLKNMVDSVTHVGGHILDLCLVKEEDSKVKCSVKDQVSDHNALMMSMSQQPCELPRKTLMIRKVKKIDNEAFTLDLEEICNSSIKSGLIDTAVKFYNESLSRVLDKHAPLEEIRVKSRSFQPQPWITEEIKQLIKIRRAKERRWKSESTKDNWHSFRSQQKYVACMIRESKRKYNLDYLSKHSRDVKKLYEKANSLLFRSPKLPLPSESSPKKLADRFNEFFIQKIDTIMDNLLVQIPLTTKDIPDEMMYEGEAMLNFTPLPMESVRKLVNKSATKSCELDPIPTSLLKDHLESVITWITDLINLSLSQGIFPECLKHAVVRPLLKKVKLDPEINKNYRPVSNLSYLGKLIESAASRQIIEHCELTSNLEVNQNAYRRGRNTETALLRVHTDIINAMDKGRVTCVILLDLSAAFDTVNHDLLLERLQFRFGIGGRVASWLKSYLVGRRQQVVIDSVFSESSTLQYGVPQGSVLGPLLYTLYTTPVGDICCENGISFQIYADDTQNYISFSVNETAANLTRMQKCVSQLKTWMTHNMLKLNTDKTEIIFFGGKVQLNRLRQSYAETAEMNLCGDMIKPATSVRNLGFFMDELAGSTTHINKVTSACWAILRNLFRVRHSLDIATRKLLVVGLIFSKIDYCNSLLLGAKKSDLHKLQLVQNTCARFISNRRKFDHISDVMCNYHWLKIDYRILFKVALIMFDYASQNKEAPQDNLKDLIQANPNPIRTRHGVLNMYIPGCRLENTKRRSLTYAGPKIWNDLPNSLKSMDSKQQFKHALKTYFFTKCYNI